MCYNNIGAWWLKLSTDLNISIFMVLLIIVTWLQKILEFSPRPNVLTVVMSLFGVCGTYGKLFSHASAVHIPKI